MLRHTSWRAISLIIDEIVDLVVKRLPLSCGTTFTGVTKFGMNHLGGARCGALEQGPGGRHSARDLSPIAIA